MNNMISIENYRRELIPAFFIPLNGKNKDILLNHITIETQAGAEYI